MMVGYPLGWYFENIGDGFMEKTALDSALEKLCAAREFGGDCYVERHYIDQSAKEYAGAEEYTSIVVTQATREENCGIVPDEEPRECMVVELMFVRRDSTIDLDSLLTLYYFDSSAERTGLIIVNREDNMVYWRNADQDPRTRWQICSLALDLEDEDGNFVFDGEPYNV